MISQLLNIHFKTFNEVKMFKLRALSEKTKAQNFMFNTIPVTYGNKHTCRAPKYSRGFSLPYRKGNFHFLL